MKPEDTLAEEIYHALFCLEWNNDEVEVYKYAIIKAMHEYHEAKLKEELEKFARGCNETVNDSCDYITIDKIDEYLKQRQP